MAGGRELSHRIPLLCLGRGAVDFITAGFNPGQEFDAQSPGKSSVCSSASAEMKRQASDMVEELTDEERKLYDRQIRLWGLDAQKRLNKFRVCIAGKSQISIEMYFIVG